MTYQETLQYLYQAAPLFQNIGAGAYKEGLSTTITLDEHFQHPHHSFRTIHVAGTNGKGSVSSTLAAILQCSGFRVGLYTSPHLLDFRERIRVNAQMIPEQRVTSFVEQERSFFEPLKPSFFELTTALAFQYFKEEHVDVAVVEVGLGGRLDCTNIITPDLSVITNISFDHTQFLGNTLFAIATEKAGIIKPHVPAVVGETLTQPEVEKVMRDTAEKVESPLYLADHLSTHYAARLHQLLPIAALQGLYQQKNFNTILCAVDVLSKMPYYATLPQHIEEGFQKVCQLTGFQGRWQQLQKKPRVICDVGHNVAGIQYVVQQLQQEHYKTLRIIFGMVNDKDYTTILSLLPKDAVFYFTQPSCHRALDAHILAHTLTAQLSTLNPQPSTFSSLSEAYQQALHDADPDDLIFVGGSCYLIADLMAYFDKNKLF